MLILPAFTDAHQHTALWSLSNCLLNISVQWLGETFNPSLTLNNSLDTPPLSCERAGTWAQITLLLTQFYFQNAAASMWWLKEMGVWKLCFGAEAVEQQAWVFFEASLLHVNLVVQQRHSMVQAGGWQPGGIYKTKVMGRTKLAAFNWGNKRVHIQQSSKKTLEKKKNLSDLI